MFTAKKWFSEDGPSHCIIFFLNSWPVCCLYFFYREKGPEIRIGSIFPRQCVEIHDLHFRNTNITTENLTSLGLHFLSLCFFLWKADITPKQCPTQPDVYLTPIAPVRFSLFLLALGWMDAAGWGQKSCPVPLRGAAASHAARLKAACRSSNSHPQIKQDKRKILVSHS